MIVFLDKQSQTDPRRLLYQIRDLGDRFGAADLATSEGPVELLIAVGILESALADALFPEADGLHPLAGILREASLAAGHLVSHSWQGKKEEAAFCLRRFSALLGQLETKPLPTTVRTKVPEGYAYYALYPEMYLEAARRCQAVLGTTDAVCLGLRSIGTSLSAVVAAGLEELGCRVRSFTFRPRGHPFSRGIALTDELLTTLQAQRAAHFMIIDEGPGISGSSLAGAAAMLERLGIPDDRVILFPSWHTDGARLQSATARGHWGRHRQFTVEFDEFWIRSGRLRQALPPGELRDYSAGKWRSELYPDPDTYPAVQPQHERRKYLLQPLQSGEDSKLLSFAGLGGRARSTLRRGERLADAGYAARPHDLVHGFMLRPFVPGTPVRAGEANRRLLEVISGYLAHLYRHHPAEPSVTSYNLQDMIRTNVSEGLDQCWLHRLEASLPGTEMEERSVELDGHMQAHEWIRTGTGYLKADAFDHFDDHFLPGCQDIAWDLAAAALELELTPGERHFLVDRYQRLSGDRTAPARLPFYAISYLSYRLGYASLAIHVLGDTPDGRRFSSAAEKYRSFLQRELAGSSVWRV